MNSTTQTNSPLRQRFLDEMRMRKLSPKTQSGYIRTVSRFHDWLGLPLDTTTAEYLRRYQLHLVDHGISPISLNVTITGLKFFFDSTLYRPELMRHMHPVHTPRKIPVVLSPDEVARLIADAGSIKNQTALSVSYGAGLRVSEVVALKVSDIDSQRMALHIEQGKGSKDRYAMLSPTLIKCLRTWWRTARANGWMLNGGWLFPGQDPSDPISTRQLSRVIHEAAKVAQIDKRVSMHTLRHSFATHLFQSRFGKAEWIQPYTTATLINLGKQNTRRVDIVCPGFVADCLETLEEIAQEGKEDFQHAGGGEYHYISCLNERPEWIHMLTDLVLDNLHGWLEQPDKAELEQSRLRALGMGAKK